MIDQAKLAQALRDIDAATKDATDQELQTANSRGELPNGIYTWVKAIRVKIFRKKL